MQNVPRLEAPTIHTMMPLLISFTVVARNGASSIKNEFHFGSASDDSLPFYSKWNEWFALAPLEVWRHRILVTIIIVFIWEFLFQPKRQAQRASDSEQRFPKGHEKLHSSQVVANAPSKVEDIVAGNIQEIGEHANIVKTNMTDIVNEEKSTSPETTTSPDNDNRENSAPSSPQNVHKLKNPQIMDPCNQSVLQSQKQERHVLEPQSGETQLSQQPVLSVEGASLNLRTENRSTTTVTKSSPRILATSSQHPGMSGFFHWYEVETSLYRIYTLTRKDGQQVVPPYIPHSYRGTLNLFLHVTNSTNHLINVYWVDYKGAHIIKGTIKPNQVWTQSTWIDHRKCVTKSNKRHVKSYKHSCLTKLFVTSYSMGLRRCSRLDHLSLLHPVSDNSISSYSFHPESR
jgi:hypothetical protein